MSEQDNSPEISANSPKSPSSPEKRFSLSKLIENIVLFIAGAAFTISLFSKNKNTETKESHKDNQKEIKESHEKAEQSQEVKNKEIKSSLSKSRITNRLRDLHSNASRKICLKLRKKITKDKFKDMLKKLGIAMGASSMVFIASWITASHWRDILNGVYPIFKYLFSDNIPLGISISLAIIVTFSMLFAKGIVTCSQKGISSLTNRYFMFTLATLAILGASSALLVPSYTNLFREPGYTSAQQDSAKETPEKVQNTPTPTPSSTGNKAAEVEQKSTSDLRLHLLYITGGIIAILGLIETNRKNSQDHIREVHAARRDRYIEAVDKLSNNNAPVRLGGIYTLVGLIDEWLDDDNIDEQTRVKEGQIIINNLCSYIRSPFPLAETLEEYEAYTRLEMLNSKRNKELKPNDIFHRNALRKRFNSRAIYIKPAKITTKYSKLHEEQDLRRTIFIEMSKRSSTFTKNKKGNITVIPGPWSKFDFDFSQAPIFYSLNKLKIEKGAFSYAKFYDNADFLKTVFIQDAEFFRTTFTQNAHFTGATFIQDANFMWSNFADNAKFDGVTFAQNAHFRGAAFTNAIFTGATFTQNANFNNTTFTQNARFRKATFTQDANFHDATFTGESKFSNADFIQTVNFHKATFNHDALFHKTTFSGLAGFSKATFSRRVYITVTTFAQGVNFEDTLFENCEPTFIGGKGITRFSVRMGQEDYNFSLHSNSQPIPPGEAELDEIKRQIPAGTVLFDPDSGRTSEPAKPIDKFDYQGETPSN